MNLYFLSNSVKIKIIKLDIFHVRLNQYKSI